MNFDPFKQDNFLPFFPQKKIEINSIWVVVKRNKLDISNSFLDIIGCYNNFQDAIGVVNGHIEYKIMGPYHLQKKID